MSEIKDEKILEEVTGGNDEESVKYPYGETGPLEAVGPVGTGPLEAVGPVGTGPLGTGPLGTGPLEAVGPVGTGPLDYPYKK